MVGLTVSEDSPIRLFSDLEFLALASARFAGGFAFATIIIALALYADIFNASGLVAGLFGTAYALIRLLLALPIGRYVDIGNSKRYLLAGLITNVVVLFGYTLVGNVGHVIFLRVLQGMGSALLLISATTVVGEIAPQEERGRWIGTFNQTFSLSSFSGDIVGGTLLTVVGFQSTYGVLIAVTVLALVLVYVFVRDNPGTTADPDELPGAESYRLLLRRNAIKALVMFRFAFSFGKMAVVLFLPIYARTQFGMQAMLIGAVLAGGKLTKAGLQGYVGSFSDRVGHLEYFITVGAILFAVGTAAIPFAPVVSGLPDVSVALLGYRLTLVPAFFFLFACYLLLGIADCFRIPTSMTLFVNEGEHYDAVAGSLSLRSVSWQVGALLGPLIVGTLFDVSSFLVGFWVAAGFIVVSAGIFLVLYAPEPTPDVLAQPND